MNHTPAMRRPPMPPHHHIARWWFENADDNWVADMGEPACFACQWHSERAPVHPRVSIDKAWARSGLQRCHLVPHARGGSVEPANLVLLCPTCHAEAPDWTDPAAMLTWMRKREHHVARRMREIAEQWRVQHGDRPLELPEYMNYDEFNHLMKRALDAGAGTHGVRLSASTIATAVATALDVGKELYGNSDGAD